ncbi:MAG: hypothetical protein V4719_23790 [Planctomycetota bacterium]
MTLKQKNDLALEVSLIIIIVGLTCLMYRLPGVKMVVLNLFFLPVLLGAFFLGRYRAGVLALLSVILVTIVAAQDFSQFAAFRSPLMSALAITIWGGVLGLSTILAGTLSDERSTQMTELHEAYIGVIEVLSKYLHSVHPQLQDRPVRVADLSQGIGEQLRLSAREIDDIRVAAVLLEMNHIEITARVVRKAIGNMEGENSKSIECTFNGADLVQSLGGVISGALPLLRRLDDSDHGIETELAVDDSSSPPIGTQIIRTARVYDRLIFGGGTVPLRDSASVLGELKRGLHGSYLPTVLQALEQALLSGDAASQIRPEPATIVQSTKNASQHTAAL